MKHRKTAASVPHERPVLHRWQIFLFAFYASWQMGVLFFSSDALSVFGRTPLPVSADRMSVVVVLGYLVSAVTLWLLQSHTVGVLRGVMSISLLASVLLYAPFPAKVLAGMIYVEAFCCVFMICGYATVAVTIFRPKEEIFRIGCAMLLLSVFAAALQNDVFRISFGVFNAAGCVCQLCVLVFLWSLSPQKGVRYDKPDSKMQRPWIQVSGFLFLAFSSGLLICFSNTVAESIPNGVTILYLGLIPGTLVFLILYFKKVNLAKIYRMLLLMQVLGFVMALASREIPSLLYASCFLLGAAMVGGELFTYYGIFLFRRYPSRRLVPLATVAALCAAGISMVLLEAFRERLTLLYAVYGVTAVGFVIVYAVLEPYYQYDYQVNTTLLNTDAFPQPSSVTSPEEHIPEAPSLPAAQPEENAQLFPELTAQENVLASLLLQGYTESAVCARMHISINTEKSYRRSVYQKLDIHSKRELFEKAHRASGRVTASPAAE